MNSSLKSVNASATVIDVRTFAEYTGGHLPGSINVPLNEIPDRIGEFRKHKVVVVCCASGIRSNKAANILKQQGIECVDGGSWLSLQQLTNLDK